MKRINMIFLLLVVVAIFGAVVLVNKNQETRRGAYFAGSKMSLLPSTATVNKGGDLLVHLVAESGLKTGSTTEKAIVENAQFYICYDKSLLSLPESEESDRIVVNQTNGFETKIVFYEEKSTRNCANITIISGYGSAMRAKLKSGVVDVGTVHFKALAAGSGTVTIEKDSSKVSGTNDSSIDKSISVDTVENMTYVVSENSSDNVYPVLNFKLAFGGVTSASLCDVNWPLQVMVLGSGVSQVYKDVKADTDNKVSLRLTNFDQISDLAVFVKGPKHLQMKYGINNQTTLYNKAGGEIGGLTTDAATSPWFDFSGLPLMAGDVTGGTVGVQDGVVDGRDFSFVKSHGSLASGREEVQAGGYLQADLDGNCFTGVQDVTLLMKSLEEKQGQLY